MTNKQKESLSKFYFNVALLSLGSLVFTTTSAQVFSFALVAQALVGLTLMIAFLIMAIVSLKGISNESKS